MPKENKEQALPQKPSQRKSRMRILKKEIHKDHVFDKEHLEKFVRATFKLTKPGQEIVSIEVELPDLIVLKIKIREKGGGRVTHFT